MMRSLLWKEWHEQGWRIAFGCVMVGAFTAIGLNVRILPDEAIIVFTMLFGAFLMPLLMAMGLISPEHSDGTLAALFALPAAPWKSLTAKLLFGALGCLLPLTIAAAITAAVAGDRELDTRRWLTLYVGASVFASVFLLWIVLLGARQPTEARVGLVGIAVFIACVVAAIASAASEGYHSVPGPNLGPLLWIINPLALLRVTFDLAVPRGSAFDNHGGPVILLTQPVLTILALYWLACRYRSLGKVRP